MTQRIASAKTLRLSVRCGLTYAHPPKDMLSPNAPVFVNVSLFENRVIADVIS